MVGMPKLVLGAVQNISERSIFFIPIDNDHIDLETVSNVPPSHRSVIQRNGLLAKVWVGVTFHKAHDSNDGVETCVVNDDKISTRGRESLWRSALVCAGLLRDEDDRLLIPEEFSEKPWPMHTEAQYTQLMEEIATRKSCSAVNTSRFCVPVLSIDEFVYKHKGLRMCLGVAWMPRYSHNLRQWAKTFANSGHPIPEPSLMTLVHHMTSGVAVLRGATNTERSAEDTLSLALTVDKVIVHKTSPGERGFGESSANQAEEGLSFVLSTGLVKWWPSAPHNDKSSVPSETTRHCKESLVNSMSALQEELTYRTPEDCSPDICPTYVCAGEKRDVWRLGVILYLLASGPTAAVSAGIFFPYSRKTRSPGTCVLAGMNADENTPNFLWKRLRQVLECRGYSSTIITVVAQLLSLDPLTRPSLNTVDCMLQDLQRPTPVHRFPFALGSYDLLRMANPTAIKLNPGARRYTMDGVCVLCKKLRDSASLCVRGCDHVPGLSSPSWSDEELLPQLPSTEMHYMTYLYPLCGSSEERQRRKQIVLALQSPPASDSVTVAGDGTTPLDLSFLFQIFGGFAVYKRTPEKNARGQVLHHMTMEEVLVPYPSQGLRRSELPLVKMTINFSGGLPWPSSCTEALQTSGRVSRNPPLAFTGAHHDVKWFGWVLPGERFSLPNGGHWTAPRDGAFVFWFNSDLQPTDRDRYFALTSVRAATLPAKVPRTVMSDSLLRLHGGDDRQVTSFAVGGTRESHRFEPRHGRRGLLRANKPHRRACQNMADVVWPSAAHEIREGHESMRSGFAQSPLSPFPAQLRNIQGSPATLRHHRGIERQTTLAHGPAKPILAAADSINASDRAQKNIPATSPIWTRHSTNNTTEIHAGAIPELSSVDFSPNTSSSHTPDTTESKNLPSPQEENVSDHAAQMKSSTTPRPARRCCTADSLSVVSHREEMNSSATQCSPAFLLKNTSCSGLLRPLSKDQRSTRVAGFPESAPGSRGSAREAASIPASVPSLAPIQSTHRGPHPHSLEKRPATRFKPTRDSFVEASLVMTKASTLGRIPPQTLSEMRVFGRWLCSEKVEAVFCALTFCVQATGEHGLLHPPVKMSSQTAHAIRAPPGAAFLSFLSNQVPLLRRNHPGLTSAGPVLMLPHHGLACYAVDGTVMGVLALRCSTMVDGAARGGEFELAVRATAAVQGSTISSRAVYASYLAECADSEPPTTPAIADACNARGGYETTTSAGPLCHVASPLLTFSSNGHISCDTPENHTLTFTSACHLAENFTLNDYENSSLLLSRTVDSAAGLSASWMGFDGEGVALLFADFEQSVWVPHLIGG